MTAEDRRDAIWTAYWSPSGTSKQMDEMDALAREVIGLLRRVQKWGLEIDYGDTPSLSAHEILDAIDALLDGGDDEHK